MVVSENVCALFRSKYHIIIVVVNKNSQKDRTEMQKLV